ncbi:MAG: teichoic acid biosynthesis protein [Myxococcales bacterium]|nr:teichoic acid biosynthesis protein [Myxococcales bacterium]
MRILYGVVGEGMGHATRSRVVLRHLVTAGHEVQIVVSGRAYDLLAAEFPDVRRIAGLEMVYTDNAVQKRKTLMANLEGLNVGLPENVKTWLRMVGEFEPEVVISDFESWSYLYGKNRRIPVISIDNMQVINRCNHGTLTENHKKSFRLAKTIIKAKLPRCAHYLVTTFFYPEVRKKRTTLVPPILRDEVLAAKSIARNDGHVLVYQSGESHGALVEVLRGFSDVEFRVYGLRRDLVETERDGNITWRPFSQQGFIDDLATSAAVIAGGGFSLMGEAVYLGKPMLTVPLVGQFEQTLNALWLEKLNYGLYREEVTTEAVGELLSRADDFTDALRRHKQHGNRALFAALDSLLNQLQSGGRRVDRP